MSPVEIMSKYDVDKFQGGAAQMSYAELMDVAHRICGSLEDNGIDAPSTIEMAQAISDAAIAFNTKRDALEQADTRP